MDKTVFRSTAKKFLKKIVRYRNYLQDQNKSRIESDFAKTETANINYALPKLVDPEQIQKYILKKESIIKLLIPTNKKKWYAEFRELIQAELN